MAATVKLGFPMANGEFLIQALHVSARVPASRPESSPGARPLGRGSRLLQVSCQAQLFPGRRVTPGPCGSLWVESATFPELPCLLAAEGIWLGTQQAPGCSLDPGQPNSCLPLPSPQRRCSPPST